MANETTDWNALCRSRYTCPAAATAYVMRKATDRERLSSARGLLSVARDPRNRFGLTVEDVNPVVVAVLEAFVAGFAHVDAAILALAQRHRSLEAAGFAQDEVWGQLEDEAAPLGFGYGDSTSLRAMLAA